MTDLDLILVNDKGRRFGVRVVQPGMRYGLDDCLTYTPGSGHHVHANPYDFLIEFYDYTYADDGRFGPRGQFVARYYASTLDDRPHNTGLCLDGGNADVWTVDRTVMRQVHQLIETRTLISQRRLT